MISPEILTAWISAFLTLAIFSFLFNDNPLYKAAEHLFAGISAGYGIVLAYWQFLRPSLLGKLWPQLPEGEEGGILIDIWYAFYNLAYNISTLFGAIEPTLLTKNGIDTKSDDPVIYFSYLIPLGLGLLMLFRLIPSLSWLARYSIAYIVGNVITPFNKSLPTGLPISCGVPVISKTSSTTWKASPIFSLYFFRLSTIGSGAPLKTAPDSPEVENSEAVLK